MLSLWNNSLVRKAGQASLSSLAEEENVPREAEIRAPGTVGPRAPSAVLPTPPICLPFCAASLRGSKENLAPWEAGVELNLDSTADVLRERGLHLPPSSLPFALQKPRSCQAGPVPSREAVAPLSGAGMHVRYVLEHLPLSVPASC